MGRSLTALAYQVIQTADLATVASAVINESPLDSSLDAFAWLATARERQPLRVEHVALSDLIGWQFRPRPLRLVHDSGKFFSIEGIRTVTDYGPVSRWDQPLIHQPEIGILGILTRIVRGVRYYLMQAKVEPGNVNGPLISPTLQATFSNYTRVHGGRLPQFLEYFTGKRRARVLVDQFQSEQGSRFLRKRNRNIILEIEEEIPIGEGFRWMTLGQIKRLLQTDNVVNMAARSVLSCVPFPDQKVTKFIPKLSNFGISLLGSASATTSGINTLSAIVNWVVRLGSTYHRHLTRRGLDRLDEWVLTKREISHRQARYFSVIGTRIHILGREVASWSQPLISPIGQGLNGLVTQKIGGLLHFLIRACLYPGNVRIFELGPTVSRSDYVSEFDRPGAPPFLKLFRNPAASTVRFSAVQSEEGGRFFQYQNRYMIIEMPEDCIRTLPEGFAWLTLSQIQQLLPLGYFNIEARNLLSCLSLI